MFSIRSRAR